MTRPMRTFVTVTTLVVLAFVTSPSAFCAQAPALEESPPVRIGAYVRSGFEACLERWTPVVEKLNRDIPDSRFVVVPLGSREDIYHALEAKEIDFLITNAAIYVSAEERFGTSAMCGMVSKSDPSGHSYTGCLIRKAGRNDLEKIEDLKGSHLSAVKPWSFAGWLIQWQVLLQHRINPYQSTAPISYEGTHEEVIQSVLNETADVGAVATDILKQQIATGKVDPKSLVVFNAQGDAVPVENGVVASTAAYPDWVFAKAANAKDSMTQQVLESLLASDPSSPSKSKADSFAWTFPQNYQPVREMLRELVGPDYAYATVEQFGKRSVALPKIREAILVATAVALVIIFLIAWRRARSREDTIYEEVESVNDELNEVRASKYLIETILTQVNCGMDIVNEHNEVVYATPGIEHHYGPWRGKRCHEYYWGSSKPCKYCTKRAAREHREGGDPYSESCHVTLQTDTHPIGDAPQEGEPGKLLQVPFYDENGRWLYARVHLPPEATLVKLDAENAQEAQE